ncbi:MAG: hypothetical protein NZ455_00630 [Bacteroidia bacterium]|nr:hypothetical protein [Bacteroidia bacterium]MDW8345411.1 hypothetical protein [Bacteroidia bacterium]
MPLGSAKRSVAPKRSAVRSSPTRAQQGTRPEKKKIKILSLKYTCMSAYIKF